MTTDDKIACSGCKADGPSSETEVYVQRVDARRLKWTTVESWGEVKDYCGDCSTRRDHATEKPTSVGANPPGNTLRDMTLAASIATEMLIQEHDIRYKALTETVLNAVRNMRIRQENR